MSGSSSTPSGPIFVAGTDRTGIGLLGELLESRPDVSMTRRTNFFSRWDGAFGDLRDPQNLEGCLAAMAQDRRMGVFAPDVAALRSELAAGEATYAHLFEILQLQLMERRSCTRWGDKSLGSEGDADTILAAYPDARMVHVIRDPRDRFASQRSHRGPVRGGAGAGSALWRWSEGLATRHSARHAARYLVVRYEDLVSDPDRELERISRFLGLQTLQAADGVIGPGEPLHTASVGRYVRDLSPAERRYIELSTRRGMARRGYEREADPMRPIDALRFWVGFVPRSIVADLGWRLRERIGHHRRSGPTAGRPEST